MTIAPFAANVIAVLQGKYDRSGVNGWRVGACIAVTSAYGACAVSGEHSLPALEAAHVRPYADGGERALSNGLLLRADIHRLYDAGYVTVTPDYRFRVSHDLADDFRRRPRVRALRRPRHHCATCVHRSAQSRAARLARGGGVQRVRINLLSPRYSTSTRGVLFAADRSGRLRRDDR